MDKVTQCQYGQFSSHRCPNRALFVRQIPGEPRPYYGCGERLHYPTDKYGNRNGTPIYVTLESLGVGL